MIYIGQSLAAIDYTSCILRWTPSVAVDIKGYDVYMQEGERGSSHKMNRTLIKESEWISPPLRRDLTYYFYVTATDLSGNVSVKGNTFPFRLDATTADPTVVVIDRFRTIPLLKNQVHKEIVSMDDSFMRFEIGGIV